MSTNSNSNQRLTCLLSLPLEGRLINSRELQARTGQCLSWHYEQERLGLFPRRVRTSSRGVAWRGEELAHWIKAREAVE